MSQYELRTIDPETEGVHPLRLELDEDEVMSFFERIDANDDTLTLEQIECAQDWLYDYIAGISQTHLGITTLQ